MNDTTTVVTEKMLKQIIKKLTAQTEFPEQYEDKNLLIDKKIEYKWRTYLFNQEHAPHERRICDNFSHFVLAGFIFTHNRFFPVARCYSHNKEYFEYYVVLGEIFIIDIGITD